MKSIFCVIKSVIKFYTWVFNSFQPDVRAMTTNYINPLSPTRDQNRISPYIISTISNRQAMRIKKNVNKGIIGWFNSKGLNQIPNWLSSNPDLFANSDIILRLLSTHNFEEVHLQITWIYSFWSRKPNLNTLR